MRKIVALVVMALFLAGTIPAFAAEQGGKERNLFVIIKDSLKPGPGKPQNQLKNPLPKVTAFQDIADGIQEGSAKAKSEVVK